MQRQKVNVSLAPVAEMLENKYAYSRRQVAGVPGAIDLFHKHCYACVIVVGNFMQALPKFVF